MPISSLELFKINILSLKFFLFGLFLTSLSSCKRFIASCLLKNLERSAKLLFGSLPPADVQKKTFYKITQKRAVWEYFWREVIPWKWFSIRLFLFWEDKLCIANINLPNKRCGTQDLLQEEPRESVFTDVNSCAQKCASYEQCKYFSFWHSPEYGRCELCQELPSRGTSVNNGYLTDNYIIQNCGTFFFTFNLKFWWIRAGSKYSIFFNMSYRYTKTKEESPFFLIKKLKFSLKLVAVFLSQICKTQSDMFEIFVPHLRNVIKNFYCISQNLILFSLNMIVVNFVNNGYLTHNYIIQDIGTFFFYF